MTETFDIAGYCRISVDEELDRDNVSIENQKAIIRDFVNRRFPGSSLTFYEDRDRSGYTFEQREGYQAMRKGLMPAPVRHSDRQGLFPLLPPKQPGAGGTGGSAGRRRAHHLHRGQHRLSQRRRLAEDPVSVSHQRDARHRHQQEGEKRHPAAAGGWEMDLRRPLRLHRQQAAGV